MFKFCHYYFENIKKLFPELLQKWTVSDFLLDLSTKNLKIIYLKLPGIFRQVNPNTYRDVVILHTLDQVRVRSSHAACFQQQVMSTNVQLLLQDLLQLQDCLQSKLTLHYITLRHFIRHWITPTVTNVASTKLFKFSECELKKMSFQKFFESISVCEFLEIGRKRIPCLWSGERETTLAKL